MLTLTIALAMGGVATGPFGYVAACPMYYSVGRPANSTFDDSEVQSVRADTSHDPSSLVCAIAHRAPGVVALLLAVISIIIVFFVGDWERPALSRANDAPTDTAGLRDRLRRCAAMQIWDVLSTPASLLRAVASFVLPTVWKPILLSYTFVSMYIPILRCFKDPSVGWAAAPAAVSIGRTVDSTRAYEVHHRRGGRGMSSTYRASLSEPRRHPSRIRHLHRCRTLRLLYLSVWAQLVEIDVVLRGHRLRRLRRVLPPPNRRCSRH